MEQQALKYLQIRHWNYWWNVYQCGTSIPACPNAVEFALTDDRAGSAPFFHFDFYNAYALGFTGAGRFSKLRCALFVGGTPSDSGSVDHMDEPSFRSAVRQHIFHRDRPHSHP